jgi:uncharacterized Zn finger protein (UPF0148 family)
MSRIDRVCAACGQNVNDNNLFCPHCGSSVESVKIEPGISVEARAKKESSVFSGFRTKLKSVSESAQKMTNKTSTLGLGEKTSEAFTKAREKMAGSISSEKASEVVGNLVDIMIQVARDLKKEIPPEVIKAIDLDAEVSFVAFSVGVSIDLEQLDSKTTIKT